MSLRVMLQRYRLLTEAITKADLKRKELRRRIEKIMERKGIDILGAEGLRALRYPTRKATWDAKALAGILERAGIPDEVAERVFVSIVDEDALYQLVEDGLIDLEKIVKAGKVRTSWGFRVDEEKK